MSKSIETVIFIQDWTIAKVILLYKSSDRLEVCNIDQY